MATQTLNEYELSFVDCLIKNFTSSSQARVEVTDCIFPANLYYNQDQQNKLTELHVSPGISFTIIDGFGTPEDSFTTQRQVFTVPSILAIQNNTLELRRYEDSSLFEICFNYSAVSDFELSVHFAASLFSSTTMLSVERSIYASPFVPCPAGKVMTFLSSTHKIFADFSKNVFPTLQNQQAPDRAVSDRFDVVIIIQLPPNQAGTQMHETVSGNDWFPCLPFYNAVTNDQQGTALPTTPPSSEQTPVHMKKELFACSLSTSALQELKSLLRLTTIQTTTSTPAAATITMTQSASHLIDFKGKVEVMEIESIEEEEQINRSNKVHVASVRDIEVVSKTVSDEAQDQTYEKHIQNSTASQNIREPSFPQYMDISAARRQYPTVVSSRATTTSASNAKPSSSTQTTTVQPSDVGIESTFISRIMDPHPSSGIQVVNIAMDIAFRFYQVLASSLPMSSSFTNSNYRMHQLVYRDMEIYGLTSKKVVLKGGEEEAMSGKTVSSSEDNVCVICMSNPKDIMFYPCRHTHVCHSCFEAGIQTSVRNHETNSLAHCPVCRERVKLALHFPDY